MWSNYASKDTGELSIFSFFVNMCGSIIRLYTTRTQLGGDPQLMLGFACSVVLNLTLVVQILLYKRRGKQQAKPKRL